MQRTLIIMVKEPRPGRVKTRLARDIGHIRAAWWFRHQTRSLIRRLRDPRWTLVLAISPDHEGMSSRVWPCDVIRRPQGRGDLGDRMGRLLRSMPNGPACIVGADIPDISKAQITRAFRELGDHDAVFGPAPDGGFWLIGLKRTGAVPLTLFQGVRWSTEHALSDTIASIPNQRTKLVDTLRDVDTIDDLRMTREGRRDS